MSYDHSRKAGNKGDVWKHFTLVTVVDRLGVKDSFRYVDVHSGAPSYELGQTGEWTRGIAAVLEECSSSSARTATCKSRRSSSRAAFIRPLGGSLSTDCQRDPLTWRSY